MQGKQDRQALTEQYIPGSLIVKFKPETSEEARKQAFAETGSVLLREIPELDLQIVAVEPGREGVCRGCFLHRDDVTFAEPNYVAFPACGPNDPFFRRGAMTSVGIRDQWGLRRINMEKAWEIARLLTPAVRIAVIDSGIDARHPDLAGRIVDPVNFSSADSAAFQDETGHGTFVAGIAAAVTDNGLGIAGAAGNTANIIPIKIGSNGYELVPVLLAIVYAVNHGARVLQMSFSAPSYAASLQQAIEFAWARGAVCVAAAGNAGSEQTLYPAGFPHVLAVSATNQDNDLAFFSSWGISVGISAPGVDILSTSPTYPVSRLQPMYDAMSGTSYASPLVSGVAAMLLAVNPLLTNVEVVQILEKSARPVLNEVVGSCCSGGCVGDGQKGSSNLGWCDEVHENKEWSPYYGHGVLDAAGAVRMALQSRLHQEGVGSFYGVAVDMVSGLPAGGVVVSARSGGARVRTYSTKTNVLTTNQELYADGMFRLMNIPAGEYDIFFYREGMDEPRKAVTAAIVPGADAFIKLDV